MLHPPRRPDPSHDAEIHDSRLRLVRRGSAPGSGCFDGDGPGVVGDEVEQSFEPGARGTAGQSNGASGAGLGLALARRLARSANGDVEAIAGDGGGRFIVRLPAG